MTKIFIIDSEKLAEFHQVLTEHENLSDINQAYIHIEGFTICKIFGPQAYIELFNVLWDDMKEKIELNSIKRLKNWNAITKDFKGYQGPRIVY
jgi:hypothetical protein